jgi:hypothetical protein
LSGAQSWKTGAAGAALAVVSLIVVTAAALASPLKPADLRVVGGEGWHASNVFSLTWTAPPAGTVAVIHYRVRDSRGDTIEEGVKREPSEGVGGLAVPGPPGVWTAEVWFEDGGGAVGPAASAQLRFDDSRPAAAAIGPVPHWIGRNAFPLRVRLDHPPGPLPLAGIRGYAVAIDPSPSGSPCLAADRCSEAETTLHGGIDDDQLEIEALPEGTSFLHVVAVSGAGMKSATSASPALRVDLTEPVTELTGVPDGWTSRAVRLSARASDARSGMEPDGGLPPFTAIRIGEAAPTVAFGGSVLASVIDEGIHRVAYYARDAAGNVDDGAQRNGIANRLPQTAWVRIDRTPPKVAFTNSQDPSDPDLIQARVFDPLSGAALARGSIGVRRAGSDNRFETLPRVRAAAGQLAAHWDSDSEPRGEYEFRAVGYDVAGNATATTRRADGTTMVLANPLKATTVLRAGFHRRGPRRTVPYGRGALIRGLLRTGISSPLPRTPLRIVERFADGARPAMRVSTAMTGPSGAFAFRAAPGPSRTISVSFDGSSVLARSTGPALELRVRSRVRLRTSARVARIGGEPLVFRGRVVAPPGSIAPDGTSVQLQFRLPGLPWSEFRTIQTDRRGRFRYAYRFSDDDSRGARFQFRAYAPAQEDWPYEPGGSRPVLVRGR